MKELERFTTINVTQMKREWAEKWVPNSFEQAKLAATTSEFEAQHNQPLTHDELTTEVRNWVKREKQATGTSV